MSTSNQDDDMPDAVRRAEAAVAALAENYTVWVREDLAVARKALQKARETAPDNADSLKEIFGVCHNIKGQGGSFGFELMTMIGDSVCEFTRDAGNASEAILKVVEAHIAALEFVVEKDIKGDGGDAGRGLLEKLRVYVSEAS